MDIRSRRWRVHYTDMAYDGGETASWVGYHRTRAGAFIAAFWNQHVASWGGHAELMKESDHG